MTENKEKEKKSVWQRVDDKEYQAIYEYNKDYMKFIDTARTERLAVKEIIRQAGDHGFIPLEKALTGEIKSGDKIYLNFRNKAVAMMVIGKESLEKGMHIVGAHLDIPRLDLKANPFYEAGELALGKTHYYGGVKKYQWPTIPLALYGYVINAQGEEIEVAIGDSENDPVFYITDLLPHLAKDQRNEKLGEGIKGEQLNIVMGHDSRKEGEEPIKNRILEILKEKYHIEEDDFKVAEFQVIAASKAREVGLDRAMIAAVGHDDRICSYAALNAILKIKDPSKTAVALFVDKEEIGSVGNTSMNSKFFENMVAEILNVEQKQYSDIYLRRAMANSSVLSADVTVAYDPTYPDVLEKNNMCLSGYGVALSKYTGSGGKFSSNDANPEFLARVRKLFEEEGVIWQTGELGKVDQGGGGTIAYILAHQGAEVVDVGTPMLSMHAPVELASKADSYMTMKAYYAFLK